jgi:uncharacterized repeat protein (TIGR01451 family)
MRSSSRFFKSLALPLGLALAIMSMVTMALLLTPNNAAQAFPEQQGVQFEVVPGDMDIVAIPLDSSELAVERVVGPARYIVQLASPPLARYQGGIEDLAATSTAVTGDTRLDVNSPASQAYLAYLEREQKDFVSHVAQVLERSPEVIYEYRYALNGVVMVLEPAEAAQLASLDGVIHVERDTANELTTDVGPTWIGAADIWEGELHHYSFTVELSGDNEVPPVTTDAYGTGTLSYHLETMELSWSVELFDIENVTAAHIHLGEEGVNGPVEIPLDHTQNPMVGSAVLTEQQQSYLMNHALYINVHTTQNPGGEIRDQIWTDGTRGEGIIVGILDTGINMHHPSFAEVSGDGYEHTNPFGDGVVIGWCDPAHPNHDPAYVCNNKLIGAWDYADASWGEDNGPEDNNGHGSHVASTAAGNIVVSTIEAPTASVTSTISGVAPRANIIAYGVCSAAGSCFSTDVVMALNQAIADGVHVVNESIAISGNTWSGAKQAAYLGVFDAGIVALRSAGNSGPGPDTVGPEPVWTISTAATTHNRTIVNGLSSMSGGDTAPPADMFGLGFTAGYGPAPIVYAAGYTNTNGVPDDGLCLVPFPADTWTNGEIVVCDRGVIARVAKGTNVADGGAGGLVLADDGNGLVGDAHFIPAVHISLADGNVLKAWLASGDDHMAVIDGYTLDYSPENGDIMADFSSRGAAPVDVIKPDIAAPGVSIWAAYRAQPGDPEQYAFVSGTSMASPHMTGAAALIRALHPGWSVAQVRSAMMTTANHSNTLKEDGMTPTDPFDVGGGRVDLPAAAMAGLVLNVTTADYQAAAAAQDGRALNLPSMQDGNCYQQCSWSRTVTNVTDQITFWRATYTGSGDVTITPSFIALAPNQSATFAVEFNGLALPQDQWHFGRIIWSETSGAAPDANLSLAAYLIGSTDPLALTKEASAMIVESGDVITYTVSVANTAPVSRTFMVTDVVPANATFVPGSESGFTYDAGTDTLTWMGEIGPSTMNIITGTRFGYISLASLGVAPFGCPSNCDEGGFIIGGLNFYYMGEHYTNVIWSINGTVEAGTASGQAASWNNQELPNPALPNNLLAPWWTDLDLTSSGNWYVAAVTAASNTYYVFEWENAPLWAGYGNPATFTFQVWIQAGTDNIWFAYGDMDDVAIWPSGTVGFENADGTVGYSYYYNGSGTAPQTDDELIVNIQSSPPVNLGFAVEATAPAGSLIVNEADASDDALNEYAAWASTIVADYGVMLSPNAAAATGAPGDTVSYMLTLTNSGNVMDTFELSTTGNTWTTTHPLTRTLAAGMSTNVTIEVAIPSGAADGVSDTVTITATSMSDPSQSDSSVLTTTAQWHRLYLPIIFKQ